MDAVVHAGADVNLLKSYAALRASNVRGTTEVLRFAMADDRRGGSAAAEEGVAAKVRPVYYISSNGVFPLGAGRCLEEDELQGYASKLHDDYDRTKLVSEAQCRHAAERGLPVAILRAGNLGFSQSIGAWNSSDFVAVILSACLEVGAVPRGSDWTFDWTPVDWAARAVVRTPPQALLGRSLHVQSSAAADLQSGKDPSWSLCRPIHG